MLTLAWERASAPVRGTARPRLVAADRRKKRRNLSVARGWFFAVSSAAALLVRVRHARLRGTSVRTSARHGTLRRPRAAHPMSCTGPHNVCNAMWQRIVTHVISTDQPVYE